MRKTVDKKRLFIVINKFIFDPFTGSDSLCKIKYST